MEKKEDKFGQMKEEFLKSIKEKKHWQCGTPKEQKALQQEKKTKQDSE